MKLIINIDRNQWKVKSNNHYQIEINRNQNQTNDGNYNKIGLYFKTTDLQP